VQVGNRRDRPAVGFLGERLESVAAPQARLDVRDRDAAVKGGDRRAHGARGVALHHDQVGLELGEHIVKPRHQGRD
jgi:hypothetical protein